MKVVPIFLHSLFLFYFSKHPTPKSGKSQYLADIKHIVSCFIVPNAIHLHC